MKEDIKGILYDKRTAGGMSDLMILVNDIFSEYDDVRWSSQRDFEYGFNYRNKKTKSSIFLGIWFDAWQLYETPLCIAIDWRGHAPYEKSDQIERYIAGLDENLFFKNIDGYATILFKEKFFDFETDLERICLIYERLSEFLFPGHQNEA